MEEDTSNFQVSEFHANPRKSMGADGIYPWLRPKRKPGYFSTNHRGQYKYIIQGDVVPIPKEKPVDDVNRHLASATYFFNFDRVKSRRELCCRLFC